jgi:hypothetical protein
MILDYDYTSDCPIVPYQLGIMGIEYVVSIHAQKRMIQRGIFAKETIKSEIRKIRSSLKKRKTKMDFQYFKYGKKCQIMTHKCSNLVLVLNPTQKVVLTAYNIIGSKYEKS